MPSATRGEYMKSARLCASSFKHRLKAARFLRWPFMCCSISSGDMPIKLGCALAQRLKSLPLPLQKLKLLQLVAMSCPTLVQRVRWFGGSHWKSAYMRTSRPSPGSKPGTCRSCSLSKTTTECYQKLAATKTLHKGRLCIILINTYTLGL